MKNLKTNICLISITAILFADCCSRPTTKSNKEEMVKAIKSSGKTLTFELKD